MPELVDAVFADARPVVFFDCREPETVAERLILALWPAARRRFAICTLALAPRTLGGRLFDLVFSPVGATSRFVGRGYRRVGVAGGHGYEQGSDEYAWAQAAASRIFESDDPNLLEWDPVGLLDRESVGDGAPLRVVSLWNALAARAGDNPAAVLGMLDILRSRKVSAPAESWDRVEMAMVKAIPGAAEGLPASRAWDFFFGPGRQDGGAVDISSCGEGY